jgi:hypothetical protein
MLQTVEAVRDEVLKRGIKPWLEWFLLEEGHNPALLEGIKYHARYYVGPYETFLQTIRRTAGPEDGILYPIPLSLWSDKVGEYTAMVKQGSLPPPLIAVDFLSGGLGVADGNKRYEALTRMGVLSHPVVYCLRGHPYNYGFYNFPIRP